MRIHNDYNNKHNHKYCNNVYNFFVQKNHKKKELEAALPQKLYTT